MHDRVEFSRAPSALAFMARAVLAPRRPGLQSAPPVLDAAWHGHRIGGAQLEAFFALTGLAGHPAWPLLYPHVVGFRLQMALLTDRRFPLPIWNALQIRNRLVLHRPFEQGAVLDFEVGAGARRVLEKGAEIDLNCAAYCGGELVWEGTNTYYYRGRFGVAGDATPLAGAPAVAAAETERWTIAAGDGLRCAQLTGDYNPIHWWGRYARRLGFRAAFQHPQRVIGECLARLPWSGAVMPLRLDAWLKGPVYYGAQVAMCAQATAAEATFALQVDGDERPAILGRLAGAAA